MRNQKGFTLIEMIVVMAVIAILASAAYPRISGYIKANRERFRASQEYVVNKALVQYYALTGRYYMPPADYLSGEEMLDAHASQMIDELNDKTGAMISNSGGEYKYIKDEGCDIEGLIDIRRVRLELD